ncbi:MAG TPA: hypothetical protein VG275_08490 [Solirubrobacteraceae bacterium]|nr:hypothetical protein [Solirubrobacteraceae bacterium]
MSVAGGIVLFRGVFSRSGNAIGWRASAEIVLAGGAATKVLATAGAGGVALTVWALRAAGMAAADVATGMVSLELLEYVVYMAALAIGGFGLRLGLFAGRAPLGLTLIPALLGTGVIVLVVVIVLLDEPVERFLSARAECTSGRTGRWYQRAAAFPLRGAVGHGRGACHGPQARSVAPRRSCLLGLRHRRPVGIVPRLRPLPAGGRARDGLLRWHAR